MWRLTQRWKLDLHPASGLGLKVPLRHYLCSALKSHTTLCAWFCHFLTDSKIQLLNSWNLISGSAASWSAPRFMTAFTLTFPSCAAEAKPGSRVLFVTDPSQSCFRIEQAKTSESGKGGLPRLLASGVGWHRPNLAYPFSKMRSPYQAV